MKAELNLSASFPIIFFFKKKEKMTQERGVIVFSYLVINLLFFVTGICRTTWSKSWYQEYLQLFLRCRGCKYHSLYFDKRQIYCRVSSKRISRPCVKSRSICRSFFFIAVLVDITVYVPVFTYIHFYKQNNIKCHCYRDKESGEAK